MAATMQVEVVSAEKRLFSGEATAVYARSLEGEIGILPGHQPALLALDIAPVKVEQEGGDVVRVAVHNGFLFYHDGHLRILADIAELESEIDESRAEQRRQELEGMSDVEDEDAYEQSLRRHELRVQMARGER